MGFVSYFGKPHNDCQPVKILYVRIRGNLKQNIGNNKLIENLNIQLQEKISFLMASKQFMWHVITTQYSKDKLAGSKQNGQTKFV